MSIDFDPSRPLVFLHQPKTGGRTLNEMLKAVYDDAMFPYKRWPDVVEHAAELPSYRFLRGHIYYDVVDFYPTQPQVMTVLRDPVDRVVSDYYFVRRTESHRRHEQAQRQTLEEFVAHPPHTRVYVRFLADAPKEGDYRRMRPDAPTEELVERARTRLDGMFLVSVTESLDATYRQMAELLDQPLPAEVPRYHRMPEQQRRKEIPEVVREIVHELGAADVALYEHARKLATRTD